MIIESDRGAIPLTRVVLAAAIVALSYLFTASRMDENLQTAGAVIVFGMLVAHRRLLLSWIAWSGLCGVFLLALVSRPLDVPNHHFMLTYLSAAIALCLSAQGDHQAELLRKNARWMFVVLMGFATVQKTLQPTFLDGSYLCFEICRGSFAKPVLSLGNHYSTVFQQNEQLIHQLRATPPSLLDAVRLQSPVAHLSIVGGLFVFSIIAIEVAMFLGMLLLPQHVATHCLIWLFVASLAVLRQEVTFLSVVCVLGLASCPDDRPRLRLGYFLASLVFAASVLKTLNL